MQLILAQENVEKEAFFKDKWKSPEYADKVYFLRDEVIRGLKPLLDRQEALGMAAVYQYVADCKSHKKFKEWPGQEDDLIAEHRDADGNWVTHPLGSGKWDVRKQTSTDATPLSLVHSTRSTGRRAVITPTLLDLRIPAVSAAPEGEEEWDSDFEDVSARKKRRLQRSHPRGGDSLKKQKKKR